MTTQQREQRRLRAAAELQEHCSQLSANHRPQQIVESLTGGMTHLRNLLMVRAHDDIQREYGADSMTSSSLARMQLKARYAKVEIEAYACIIVDDEVSSGGYADVAGDWFLPWLFRLRLGAGYESVLEKRVDYYQSENIEERRLKFVSALQHAMPDSGRAPLVLFRLFPRALRILPAVAFADPLRAQQLRGEQASLLPAIGDCNACHGRVLDNDESCVNCGNPLWKLQWLLAD